jgi:hypothetical protein
MIGSIWLNNITKENDVFVIFFKYLDHVLVEAYCLAIYKNTFYQWLDTEVTIILMKQRKIIKINFVNPR